MKSLKVNKSPKGQLVVQEFRNFPFNPKRFFVVSGVGKGETRGYHAHREESQILVCLRGKITLNNEAIEGVVSKETLLPNECFFLDKLVWSEQTYEEEDTILLCFCYIFYFFVVILFLVVVSSFDVFWILF